MHEMRRWPEAHELFMLSIAIDPDMSCVQRRNPLRLLLRENEGGRRDAWYNLGLAFRNAGATHAALTTYRHLVTLRPTDFFGHTAIGMQVRTHCTPV